MKTTILKVPLTAVKNIVVLNPENSALALEFAPEEASFARSDNSLTISFDNNGVIEVVDFFAPAEGSSLPALVLSDGTSVNSADFLAAMNPDLDVTPAAAATHTGSGVGDYSDNAGELVNGLTGSDSLGNIQWSSELGVNSLEIAPGQNIMGTSSAPTVPVAPPVNPPVEPPVADDAYHTRLIVTETKDNQFSFYAVDKDGNLVSDAAAIGLDFANGSEYFNIVGIDPLTGKITVELTQAGLDALADGSYISDILTVSVNGEDYSMPLVLNPEGESNSYSSADEEARDGLEGPLYAEWYAADASDDTAPLVGTVAEESIVLGGEKYNSVEISAKNSSASGNAVAVQNSHIDISVTGKGDVNIQTESQSGSAYAFATQGDSGSSAGIIGGAHSQVNISAATGNGNAYAVYNDAGNSSVQAGNIAIKASGTGTSTGVLSTNNGVTQLEAENSITINATSNAKTSSHTVTGLEASNGGEVYIKTGPDGKLEISTSSTSPANTTPSATGLSAANGGSINIESADILIESSTNRSTATAIYAQGESTARSSVNINGLENFDNHMKFTANANSSAVGIKAAEYADVNISGKNLDDTIIIESSATGIDVQKNSTLNIDGGAGQDSFILTSNGTGINLGNSAYKNTANIENIENVQIRSGHSGMVVTSRTSLNISSDADKSLTLNVSNLNGEKIADNAYALNNKIGTVSITGHSSADTEGDKISLNGNVSTTAGTTTITTGSGDDSVHIGGNVLTQAQTGSGKGSLNISTGAGNDNISIDGALKASTVYLGASNTIDAGSGQNTINVGGGMSAHITSYDATNTIIAGDDGNIININGGMRATSEDGPTEAKNLASNNILTGSGADIVSVNGGIFAQSDSSIGPKPSYNRNASGNIINLGDGDNELTVNGNISALSTGNNPYGTAKNSIISGNDDDTIIINGNISANSVQGIEASNTISTGAGQDSLIINGNVSTAGKGKNVIDGHDSDSSIEIKASGSALSSTGDSSSAGDGGLNEIKNAGQLNINSSAGNGQSIGLSANSGGSNKINSVERIEITSTGGVGKARALSATDAGENTISNVGSLNIEVTGHGVNSEAIYSLYDGKNNISADNIDISVTAKPAGNLGGAYALYANQGGQNAINVANELNIDVTGHNAGGTGLHAYSGQAGHVTSNTINASADATININVAVTGDTNNYFATAMYASGSNATNIIKGNDINLTAEGNAVGTRLMHALDSGQNILQATEGHGLTVNITVAGGEGKALYALYASSNGSNSILGNGGDLDNISIFGGLQASSGGQNIINSSSSGSSEISITGNINAADSGSSNSIMGGAGSDYIVIAGNLDSSTGASNYIDSGAGSDFISITGNLTNSGSGDNFINSGAGSDFVHIDGQIGSGGLSLQMGDDYDTLILTAGSLAEFKENYGNWLNSAGFQNANVEAVHVDLGSDNQTLLSELLSYLNGNSAFDGLDISYSLGGTLYLDHDSLANINLADLFGSHDMGEIKELNLSDGNSSELNIDTGIVAGLNGNSLKISGDDSDKIVLEGNWNTTGEVINGYVTYTSDDYSVQVQANMLDQLIISGSL